MFGQYALNYDGTPDIRDRERVETIVTRSGSVLADGLSFDADYLVLGSDRVWVSRC